MTPVRVVAAVVERDGRLLLGLRPPEKRHGGLWEFPGGKLDPGETAAEAARRELAEELGVVVTDVGERLLSVGDDPSPFVIEFFPVSITGGPSAIEHAEIAWFTVAELAALPLAPADRAFATWLGEQDREGPAGNGGDPPLSPSGSRS